MNGLELTGLSLVIYEDHVTSLAHRYCTSDVNSSAFARSKLEDSLEIGYFFHLITCTTSISKIIEDKFTPLRDKWWKEHNPYKANAELLTEIRKACQESTMSLLTSKALNTYKSYHD